MTARRIARWYPLLRPTDAVLISAPDLRRWIIWCRAAVQRLEGSQALILWRDAMAPHLATIRAIRPEAANLIATLTEDRIAALAVPLEEPAA